MSNTENVSVGKPKVGGAISVAPVGTTLPTNARAALDAAFAKLGYASEDGVTNNNTPEADNVKAWGGDTVLVLQTSKEDTFGFTLIECLSKQVLQFVYGTSNVTGDITNGIVIKANSEEQEEHAIIIDMNLRGGVLKRVVIPRGRVSEVGEITYADESAIGYATTITCLPDENGNTHYEYIQKASGAVASYTVTFDTDGGSSVADQDVDSGDTATVPTPPTKSSYTFKGWYSDAALTTPYDFTTPVTADITIHAKWEANS
jgi:uncharacterized repeat protein (TIGR02543 family)